MSCKILTYLHGQLIGTLELESGQTYTIGRSNTCDIVLENKKGISREHLQVIEEGGQWKVEIMSKLGALIFHGESKEDLLLQDQHLFTIPPYEFKFEQENAHESLDQQPPQEAEKTPDEQDNPNTNLPMNIDIHAPAEAPIGDMESTASGIAQIRYSLEATYPSGEIEVFKLEGHSWIAGRDPDCSIYLRDDHVSRQHFEINQSNDGFYITDLGSSNGTYLNKEKLHPNEAVLLRSGDRLKIKKLSMTFKIENISLQNQLIAISSHPPANLPMDHEFGGALASVPMNDPFAAMIPYQGPAVVQLEEPDFSWKDPSTYEKKHKLRVVTIAIIAVLIGIGLLDKKAPTEGTEKLSSCNPANTDPLCKLTEGQRDLIKHSLRLANSHKGKRNFQSCLTEVQKIHELVPNYNDSQRIESVCKSGLESQKLLDDKERQERAAEEARIKIEAAVKRCGEIVATFETPEEVDTCLGEAWELDPGNAEFETLRITVREKNQALADAREAAQAQQQRVAEGQALFNKAVSTYKSKKLRLAMKQLADFVNSNYPDPSNNKAKAQRMIASAKTEFGQILSVSLKECEALLEKSNYKAAHEACAKVLKQDPGNDQAKELNGKLKISLKKKMKQYYDNASIEESFGNIEAAKELWKKIVNEDFPNGTAFYNRAKSKLKTYGVY